MHLRVRCDAFAYRMFCDDNNATRKTRFFAPASRLLKAPLAPCQGGQVIYVHNVSLISILFTHTQP